MNNRQLGAAFRRLRSASAAWTTPIVTALAQRGASPFEVLVVGVLSARTLDTVTARIAPNLLALARTPSEMANLPLAQIARTIRGIGFAENKARQLAELSRLILERHDGQVPADLEALDALPGVGRKVANLVLSEAFGLPAICVDTHVHRITNRWGYVRTRTPDETEEVLRDKLPRPYWNEINPLLVMLGQNVCRPTSPRCPVCPISQYCDRVGVEK